MAVELRKIPNGGFKELMKKSCYFHINEYIIFFLLKLKNLPSELFQFMGY